MPKATFNDFIKAYPMCNQLQANDGAKKVFDLLNQDGNIFVAIFLSEQGSPALAANVAGIDALYDDLRDMGFDLSIDLNRQAVGRMQKVVLEKFGYVPGNKSKDLTSSFFKTATCYVKDGFAEMRVRVISEEI